MKESLNDIIDKSIAKKNLPSSIILGGEEIELKFFDAFEQRNNDNKGYYNSEFQVIGIAENQKPLTMANTFLHEIIHAIIKTNNYIEVIKNIEDEDSLDEIIAHQLSSDLQEFFVVNPRVTMWYMKLLMPEKFMEIKEPVKYGQ